MKAFALVVSLPFLFVLPACSESKDAEREFENFGTDAYSQLFLSPFAAPRDNFFQAALEVPPFESGRTLPQDAILVRLRTAHPRSLEERTIDGYENVLNGRYHEWTAVEFDWGVSKRCVRAPVAHEPNNPRLPARGGGEVTGSRRLSGTHPHIVHGTNASGTGVSAESCAKTCSSL